MVEHCVSSAKGRGFNSQGTHILIKKCIHCKSLWIKASAKCINVNDRVWGKKEAKNIAVLLQSSKFSFSREGRRLGNL